MQSLRRLLFLVFDGFEVVLQILYFLLLAVGPESKLLLWTQQLAGLVVFEDRDDLRKLLLRGQDSPALYLGAALSSWSG